MRIVVLLALAALSGIPANAALMLTPDGAALGFTLTTFATTNPGNTGCCSGPFGVAVDRAGHVIVGTGAGPRYVFADIDGQTPASALFTDTSFGTFTGAYAESGGIVYGATGAGGFVSFRLDGSVADFDVFPGIRSRLGLWTNPADGHLIAQSEFGLVDIDPAAKSWRVIAATGRGAVSVSPDGTTAYVKNACIQAVNIASGALGACYPTSGAPDGTAVIRGGALDGFIVVNTNAGNVGLIDPFAGTFVTVASGGTRGDYAAPDPNTGTLFLTFSDIVARLDCPGCSFAPERHAVPEPAPLAIVAAAFVFARRRRRQAVTVAPPARGGVSTRLV